MDMDKTRLVWVAGPLPDYPLFGSGASPGAATRSEAVVLAAEKY